MFNFANGRALLLSGAIVFCSALSAQAKSVYIAQTTQGIDTGADAADAHSVTWFNTAADWGAGSTQIGPGDTVHLTGTITSALIVQGSGTSGNITTILFDPGANMTSPAWSSAGAIQIGNRNYITIDGGATGVIGGYTGNSSLVNGIIQNTSNGTALASQAQSIGIFIKDSTFITVQNLAIYNLYVRTSTTDLTQGSPVASTGIFAKWNGGQASSNFTVSNCLIHDAVIGVSIAYAPGTTNCLMELVTAYNCNWGGQCGDADPGCTLTGMTVRDCYFYNWANWDDTTGGDSYHHNGFYGWAEVGGSLRNVSIYQNFIGGNYGTTGPTSGVFVSGDIAGILIYNNIFIETPGTSDHPGDGLVFIWHHLGSATAVHRVYNNTFVGGGSGVAVDVYTGLGPSITTYDIEDNIMLNMATAVNINYEAANTVISDYNNIFNVPAATEFAKEPGNSSNFNTFSQWQALGYDLHSTVLTPNLNGSYMPQDPSGAIDTGVNLSSYVTTDTDGVSRPQGAGWDMGAFEFIPPGPSITSSFSESGTEGSMFTYTVTGTGSPTSFSATGLPAGLAIDTTTGIISGTPTTYGTTVATISATNGGGTGSAFLTITETQVAPVITSATTASGSQSTAFTYTITASNSPASFSATGLPAGLSVNTATGVISGTPSVSGAFNITVGAANTGGSGTGMLTLTLAPAPPVITSQGAANATKGLVFTFTITATNSPTSFTATGMPAGLSIDTSTGVISGTPTGNGTTSVSISATNVTATATGTLKITVNVPPVPVITSSTTASTNANIAFTYTISATNSPSTFAATGLPSGLTVNTSTGVINGTPTAIASSTIHLSATNGGGTGTATLTLTVSALLPPVVSSANTANGSPNSAFSYTITASNSPSSYNATGLPAGLSINTNSGVISGTPTASSVSNVTISATNASGTGSATLSLTISVPLSAPAISSSSSATAVVGGSFSYAITASNLPNSYNATGLPPGITVNSTTGVISGTPSAVGSYNATISATNSIGTGSSAFTLDVIAPAARLINLSARTSAGTGSNTLIAGFVISGGSESILVRGIGPTLGNFSVSGFLPDPQLAIFNGPTNIQSDTTWGGTAGLASVFSQVGAFSLSPSSADSALLSTLTPGAYTAQVSGISGDSGVALAEIYDADPDPLASPSRLINLSARSNVGTGANILIAGFVIGGSGTETVLIRADGPTLSTFGVTGVLANPVLTLFDSNGNSIATNSAWGGTSALANAFSLVGAFPLPAGSNDSALLVTLQPGAYTAQVTGSGQSTGVALVEIYEVP